MNRCIKKSTNNAHTGEDFRMIKLSIIIPVYNVEKYLEACIRSVLKQTYRCWEMILVDDGSTDSSGAICDFWSESDERIYAYHQANSGISAARNTGIQQCKGDYILFLDSDDYYAHSTFFELGIEELKKRSLDVLIFGYTKYYETTQKNVSSVIKAKSCRFTGSKNHDFLYLVKKLAYTASAWNKFIKRSLVIENKLFFKNGMLSEDVEWSGRLAVCMNQVGVLEDVAYVYRQREYSITKSVNGRHINDLENAINFCLEALPETSDSDFRRAYYSYVGYQICNYIICLRVLDETERKQHYEAMESFYKYIRYNRSLRSYAIRICFTVFGWDCTFRILEQIKAENV